MESDDGLATNQVSAVQVAGAVKEETDGESMEIVSDLRASVDAGHQECDQKDSHKLSEHGDPVVAGEDKESKDAASQAHGDECEQDEGKEVKTEEEFEQNVAGKDDSLEDAHLDSTSEELKDIKVELDMDTEEDMDTEQETEGPGNKSGVSITDNLDEIMDIGTVDQVDQEALMKEEKENSLTDGSHSPSDLNTASAAKDNDSFEEEADVKPPVLSSPASEDQSERPKATSDSILSPSSAGTERDGSSPETMMNGMKVVQLSIPRLDPETSCEDAQAARSSPSPPLVKVKDEPIDEEYDQALISSVSTASVKLEPSTAKEDLRIGSVFSVTPTPETHSLPIVNPSSLQMSCSHCKKSLMKGQTAFQRKGSPALFCSTSCLTTSLPSGRGVPRSCLNCQKLIIRPQEAVLGPDGKGNTRDFCSQNCLNSYSHKKGYRLPTASKTTTQPAAPQSLCSMCSRYCTCKHEVTLSGSVHKICSDACFNRFRSVNKLSMAGCANCGSYCHSKPLMLKLDDSNKTLCNAECLAKYKEKTKVTKPCAMCRTTRLLAEMVDNKNSDDSVNVFCSSSCVMAFKVQTVSASGARVNCDSCGKNTVPAYHLAMSDTSIRNFCTLPCVMTFQEKFKKSQKQVNVFTKLPIGSGQIQTGTTTQTLKDVPKRPPKLNCAQCSRNITFKPDVLQIKDKLVFFCSPDCAHEFKKDNYVTSLCEYCKIEKITRESKRINNKDCFFCSDGCKLLFRHDLTKSWGKHCHSCVYCHSMSKKLVTAQYGGTTEEFCSDECRSRYTMLFCHVAKCDTCGHKGKLKQSLPMLGAVRHFCDLHCLLQFCADKVATQGEDTPVIANVISLADSPKGRSSRTAQQRTVCDSKNSGHISIQTDAVKSPPAVPKTLKNKAVLCRPLVQNKGVSCKTQTSDVEAQTDDVFPKIMVVPVPVPVYVPVPMNMYSQCTPKPVGLPLPVPVPMFLPVTVDSAERIVETIQEIKEKIPSDPFEAELILMAEMVAEQDEKNDKEEERPKEKVEKERVKGETTAPDDHTSNFSDDLDTEDLASFLNNWEEASPDAAVRSPNRPCVHEKLNTILDIPAGATHESDSEPAAPPPMDLEADLAVETLERMSLLREESRRSPSPLPASARRRQAHRKAREKKGRKSQRSKTTDASGQRGSSNKAATADSLKLKSQYGVDAWRKWIQWRQTQPNVEKPRISSRPMVLKEDVLRCTTAELSYGLCCFITEVKRPNGEPYSPDSLFYLCLGIQQYLFENGRVENIFMDRFYNKFSTEFNNMLRGFKPSITASGYIHSRVEEGFLWDCKQLGAYSPIVLLNTLLFFCCKYFGFTTVEQHRQLSFAHVMRCTRTNQNNTKTTFLRFYPPMSINEPETDPEVPTKKRKEEESKEDILEMMENTENPLRCPVRLYEFYLSKCSESVKQRTNLFYLHPERCCVPNSPLWFSSTPLDDAAMEGMLVRILTVRELHLRTRRDRGTAPKTSKDPLFIPHEEDEDEDDDEDSE